MGAAIVANMPQLLLSIAYLAYNGLFTRTLSEREWASYGVSFQPLRVSQRKGLQKPSYRLQLPFRWSVPLIIASGTLHWLASNCIYIQNYQSRWYFHISGLLSPCSLYSSVPFSSSHHLPLFHTMHEKTYQPWLIPNQLSMPLYLTRGFTIPPTSTA
jgi:hypothetical protein